ncbi:hypothetical protein ACSFA0_22700 [Variovorax sp. LT1P1]|uniref:hypothetical protein n=1 Tax=Variovorax sp. LT1P1 TaxID=3443730 RepID=UPI003F44D0E7
MAITCAAGMLAACATHTHPIAAKDARPVPADRILGPKGQSQPGLGRLVVTRDSGSVGGLCFIQLTLNGKPAARFDAAETAEFFVPAGEVLLKVGSDAAGSALCSGGFSVQRESTIKSGETKSFRIFRTLDTVDIQRAND